MQIEVPQAILQTEIFLIIFLSFLLLTSRKKTKTFVFNLAVTNEIKGFAIVFIIFAHIGYYLSKNTNFLFPMSVLAGVGVNLFLLLSGFGLTMSQIQRPISRTKFYLKRLERLYIPLWIILIILLIADHFILKINYPAFLTIQNFLGLFPQANLFSNIDSPLWYFTLILFYYLIFPFTYFKKINYLSPVIILATTYLIINLNLPYFDGTNDLYKVHSLSFPLGMLIALSTRNFSKVYQSIAEFLKVYSSVYILIFISLIIFVCYTAINSGVGQGSFREQFISLCTMQAIVLIFILKKNEFRLFNLFGNYSYEIYLFHWPLLYRYDIMYKTLPAFLATLAYLPIFLIIAKGLQKLTDFAVKILKFKRLSGLRPS